MANFCQGNILFNSIGGVRHAHKRRSKTKKDEKERWKRESGRKKRREAGEVELLSCEKKESWIV